MKAIDFELGLIFIIIGQFYYNASRETITITCFILFMLLLIHYIMKNRGDLFE